MCGIIGIYNSNTPAADHITAALMANSIARRGPDAQGVMQLDNTTFAHRRLAIIDLDSSANQPMCDVSGKVMITFNGEIYNYRQLRQELLQQGAKFRTASDTEVILQLYIQYGADALSKLDGMFAFALYDSRSRELLLMRDRLGKKPLYYFSSGPALIFASTLQALKKHPLWQGEIDAHAIEDFLAYEYIPQPGSVYKNVCQLPAASLMRCRFDGQKTIQRYWQLDFRKKLDLSLPDAAELLREKLFSATAKRLIADVPCGIYLSGGVDSAITAMLAARQSKEQLQVFTIGFEESAYDERQLAALTANFIDQHTPHGIQHNCQVVNCRSFETLQKTVQIFGEPFADFSLLPCTFLSEFAASKVKLVLSGDGADELFGGYERYQAMQYCAQLDKLLPGAARRLLAFAARTILPDRSKRSRAARLRRFLQLAAAPRHQRYLQLMTQNSAAFRQALYGERLRNVAPSPCGDYINEVLRQATSPDLAERCSECDITTYLQGDILVKVDRTSMANSLEVRSPFLDTGVVELSAALPFSYKQFHGERKRILKMAAGGLIDPQVANGRKKGFAVPLAYWFRNQWKDLLQAHLLTGSLVRDGWFDRNALHNLLQQHFSCRCDHSELLGALLMLELFLSSEKN